jgi:hypothetical protein
MVMRLAERCGLSLLATEKEDSLIERARATASCFRDDETPIGVGLGGLGGYAAGPVAGVSGMSREMTVEVAWA